MQACIPQRVHLWQQEVCIAVNSGDLNLPQPRQLPARRCQLLQPSDLWGPVALALLLLGACCLGNSLWRCSCWCCWLRCSWDSRCHCWCRCCRCSCSCRLPASSSSSIGHRGSGSSGCDGGSGCGGGSSRCVMWVVLGDPLAVECVFVALVGCVCEHEACQGRNLKRG